MLRRPSSWLLVPVLLAGCPDEGGPDDATSPTTTPTAPTAPGTSEPTTGGPTGDPSPTGSEPGTGSPDSEPTTTSHGTSPSTATTSGETTTTGGSTGATTDGTTAETSAETSAGTSVGPDTTGGVDCSDQPATEAGPEVVIAPEFAGLYTTYDLGPVPGIPADARLGGGVIKFDDPNTLLIAGYSEAANGQLYSIGVVRGNCDHIVAFAGQATSIASTPYIDANLIYVQSGLLFYSEWPVNNLSQLLPGAAAPARTTALGPLGVTNSIGGIGFVPPDYASPGEMRLLSWPGGEWAHLDRQPDGDLFTVSNPVQTATLPNGPGGFAYVPKGSPGFATDHLIVSEWSTNTVGVYQSDAAGDPDAATRKDFFTTFPRPWGAYFEPLTGDFVFLTWGAAVDRVYIVQGFMAPPPIPQ